MTNKQISSLEDIDLSDCNRNIPVDELPRPVDPKVKNLVRVIRALGFTTGGSCEGHLGEFDGLSYPWVTSMDFRWNEEKTAYLVGILEIYNAQSKINWHIKDVKLMPKGKTDYKIHEIHLREPNLRRYQKGANDLAEFLFGNYVNCPTNCV